MDRYKEIVKKLFGKRLLLIALSLIFTLSLPATYGTVNYKPFKILTVSFSPSVIYRITFDLPKPADKNTEENLSKTFGIPLSSLKRNERLSKPKVYLAENPVTKTFKGFVEIGGRKLPFSEVENKFTLPHESGSNSEKLPDFNVKKILLTAYFTLNNNPMHANIFLAINGSVLQYASMAVQDKNDNILGLFRRGKLLNCIILKNDSVASAKTTDDGSSKFYGNSWMKPHACETKYLNLSVPFGKGKTLYFPAFRTAAMSDYPFVTEPGFYQSLAMRVWAFQNEVADAFGYYYGKGFPDPNVDVGVPYILNTYRLRYSADANVENINYSSRGFSHIVSQIAFEMNNTGKFEILLGMPHGRMWKWYGGFDMRYGGGSGIRNVVTHRTQTVSCDSADAFDPQWNDSLRWKAVYAKYLYDRYRYASSGGYYTYMSFVNWSSGNAFYCDFSSNVIYSVLVNAYGGERDFYCIDISQNFRNVRLDS